MLVACRTCIAALRPAGLVLTLLGGVGCTQPPSPGPPPTGAAVTGPAVTGPAAPDPAASGTASSGQGDLPPDAVAVGPDLYQVPIGTDAEGCQMYRLHAPGRMVTQAIAWRRADGSFTLDRREADCAR